MQAPGEAARQHAPPLPRTRRAALARPAGPTNSLPRPPALHGLEPDACWRFGSCRPARHATPGPAADDGGLRAPVARLRAPGDRQAEARHRAGSDRRGDGRGEFAAPLAAGYRRGLEGPGRLTRNREHGRGLTESGRRGSNPRPSAWESAPASSTASPYVQALATIQGAEAHPDASRRRGHWRTRSCGSPAGPGPSVVGLPSSAPALLTVREVARRLGVRPVTVYRLCDRGELAHVRVSYAIRVRPEDLDAYLHASSKGGTAERE